MRFEGDKSYSLVVTQKLSGNFLVRVHLVTWSTTFNLDSLSLFSDAFGAQPFSNHRKEHFRWHWPGGAISLLLGIRRFSAAGEFCRLSHCVVTECLICGLPMINVNPVSVFSVTVIPVLKCNFTFFLSPSHFQSGKVSFSYIYGIGVLGCLAFYCLLSLMATNSKVTLGAVISVLGYCLLPMVVLSGINVLITIQ